MSEQDTKIDQKNLSCAIYLLDFLEFPFFTMSNAIPTYLRVDMGFTCLRCVGDLEISCVWILKVEWMIRLMTIQYILLASNNILWNMLVWKKFQLGVRCNVGRWSRSTESFYTTPPKVCMEHREPPHLWCFSFSLGAQISEQWKKHLVG